MSETPDTQRRPAAASSRRRILTVVPRLTRGGTERAAELFSVCYANAGHDVAVLAPGGGGRREESLRALGIPLFIGGEEPNERAAAIAAAAGWGAEVIHIHRPGMASEADTELLRALDAGHKAVLETNVFGRYDPGPGGALIDVHMQLSAWCLRRWRRWSWPDGRRKAGVVMPYPVDTSAFARAGGNEIAAFRREVLKVPEDALIIGRIGQRLDGKWHPGLVRVFARLAAEDPRLHLATVGMPESCRNAVAALPEALRSRAIDVGYIDGDDKLATAFSAFDLFLHAAVIGESFGYVLVEAMLCECPVVALSRPHKDNSQVEVVGHRVGGLIAASEDGMHAACRELLGDAKLRQRLGEGGRASVVERFEADRVARAAIVVAEHVLAATSRADLTRRLDADPALVTRVPRATIKRLLAGSIGATPASERLLAAGVFIPAAHRAFLRASRLRGRLRGT